MATEYGRYGYRQVAALLRREGWQVNHKRVERIWRQEGLEVPQKQPKRRRRVGSMMVPACVCTESSESRLELRLRRGSNDRWSGVPHASDRRRASTSPANRLRSQSPARCPNAERRAHFCSVAISQECCDRGWTSRTRTVDCGAAPPVGITKRPTCCAWTSQQRKSRTSGTAQ